MLEHFIKESGLEYRREYKFHPTRKWRFDFAFPTLMIAVEIEGATYQQGRHTRGKGYRKDCEKYNAAACLGWTVLRYTTDMIKDNPCWPVEDIKKHCLQKKTLDTTLTQRYLKGMKRTTIRLPDKLKDKLTELAKKDDRSFNTYVVRILIKYIDKLK